MSNDVLVVTYSQLAEKTMRSNRPELKVLADAKRGEREVRWRMLDQDAVRRDWKVYNRDFSLYLTIGDAYTLLQLMLHPDYLRDPMHNTCVGRWQYNDTTRPLLSQIEANSLDSSSCSAVGRITQTIAGCMQARLAQQRVIGGLITR